MRSRAAPRCARRPGWCLEALAELVVERRALVAHDELLTRLVLLLGHGEAQLAEKQGAVKALSS